MIPLQRKQSLKLSIKPLTMCHQHIVYINEDYHHVTSVKYRITTLQERENEELRFLAFDKVKEQRRDAVEI